MNSEQEQMLVANLCMFCWHKSGDVICKAENKPKCILLKDYKENIRKIFEETERAWHEYIT